MGHSCPILSNRFHPTKQLSICCRSENCISLARSGQSAVDSIDSFNLSYGKVYYRFDKCGHPSDNCISLVTTATRCKIVESIDSFNWWEWLFHSRFHIKSLSNRWIHLNDDYKCTFLVGRLIPMFHREGFINRVQNGKQVSRFCLDHSHARNGRVIQKQLKQTCRTKQRNEK